MPIRARDKGSLVPVQRSRDFMNFVSAQIDPTTDQMAARAEGTQKLRDGIVVKLGTPSKTAS